MLTSALIERTIRHAMTHAGLDQLSLYPEDRGCAAPTTARILEIFTGVPRHVHAAEGCPRSAEVRVETAASEPVPALSSVRSTISAWSTERAVTHDVWVGWGKHRDTLRSPCTRLSNRAAGDRHRRNRTAAMIAGNPPLHGLKP
jgi:hypothetical protein